MKSNTAVKGSMGNHLLSTDVLNTLLPAISPAASITYTLIVVLLIKRRNVWAKQNQFVIKRMNVCFKRIKNIANIAKIEENGKFILHFL